MHGRPIVNISKKLEKGIFKTIKFHLQWTFLKSCKWNNIFLKFTCCKLRNKKLYVSVALQEIPKNLFKLFFRFRINTFIILISYFLIIFCRELWIKLLKSKQFTKIKYCTLEFHQNLTIKILILSFLFTIIFLYEIKNAYKCIFLCIHKIYKNFN